MYSFLKKSDGSLTASNQEVASTLATFLKQLIIMNEETSSLPTFSRRLGDFYLSEVHISEDVVLYKLCNLKPYKSPGPDSSHVYVLKACAGCLVKPLCILFRQSLTTGHIPNDWKCANITPVFKKGSKSKPPSYRPICLTSQVAKML